MGEIKNPTIIISNLGPINRAKIELKPLSIFIGGHNTGKSYAAQMVYCMARALRSNYRRIKDIEEPKKSEDKVVRKELKDLQSLIRRGGGIKFSGIGKTLQNKGENWWVSWEKLCKDEIISSLNQYFMTEDIGDLVRFNGESVKGGITFSAVGKNDVRVRLRIGKTPGKVNVSIDAPSIKALGISIPRMVPNFDYFDFQVVLMEAWRKVWKGIADYDFYYLPAARSGILQLWDMMQLYTLESLPEEMGIPGLVKNFLLEVARSGMYWTYREKRKVMPALEILEGEILRGEIAFRRERPGLSRIDYKFGGRASISIQRASSMVAELAPLDLWIKRLLNEGDLLIIEEPEAHLHPSSQIQIARLIARLVNSGIRIICTTHSQLLVNKISNLMLASKAQESVREDIGLKEVDIIKEEDLAVYQFIATDNGSRVKKLRMISKFGIPEDEFLSEYEKISLESYKVSS